MFGYKSRSERKRESFVAAASAFSQSQKSYNQFIIIADVATNVVYVSYRGYQAALHNKSRTRRISEMFVVDSEDDERNTNYSKREIAIRQFLMEVDGVINEMGISIRKEKEGKKGLTELLNTRIIQAIGVQDEKGNVKELLVQ